ncbi:sugar transporter [Apiospora hydei]|uniref:Sugar transporter n=1 Tax=Apiospora hydei TaxID=1337664 RepID=A0ABR1V471_9PEZI
MPLQPSASLPAAVSASSTRRPSNTTGVELPDRTSVSTGHTRFNAQLSRRRHNNQAVIVNPLSHLTDEELVADVHQFQAHYLGSVESDDLLRAARVAKDVRTYDEVARSEDPAAGSGLPVTLDPKEKEALKAEKDVLFSERGMFIVILTGSQHVPSGQEPPAPVWRLGAANASPFLFAAVVGCFVSLPINDLVGRRGAMAVAAVLIFGSSLGSAWCRTWGTLFGVRAINGIGMGIKAVSTPILASETAVGFWRGSSILAWQLCHEDKILSLILGSPCVPALFLLAGLWFCPESPRYYMRRKSSRFSPMKAYEMLKRIRTTECIRFKGEAAAYFVLQALRDIYLIHKSVQLEEYSLETDVESQEGPVRKGLLSYLRGYLSEYADLATRRRLRNALVSSSTVNLAQQLCGRANTDARSQYAGIQLWRKWLILTLPLMCLAMLGAALSAALIKEHDDLRVGIVTFFLYLFSAAYSPDWDGGALGLFSGLNLLAFALVFLLVEETKRRSLEDLDLVFAVRKGHFIKHQLTQYLPRWFQYYIRRDKTAEQPSLYLDLIWGPKAEQSPGIFDPSNSPPHHHDVGEQSIEPEDVRNSTDTDHN